MRTGPRRALERQLGALTAAKRPKTAKYRTSVTIHSHARDVAQVFVSDPNRYHHPATDTKDSPVQLLTIDEVAERLATTDRHVRNLIYRGELPKIKVGHLVRISDVQLAEFIERRTLRATA